jgi:hypothetical protein
MAERRYVICLDGAAATFALADEHYRLAIAVTPQRHDIALALPRFVGEVEARLNERAFEHLGLEQPHHRQHDRQRPMRRERLEESGRSVPPFSPFEERRRLK